MKGVGPDERGKVERKGCPPKGSASPGGSVRPGPPVPERRKRTLQAGAKH